jgi:hypothetical protein
MLRLNKMKQQQMAYHIQDLIIRSAALEQSVHGLHRRREKYLLSSQEKLQQKVDTFALSFDDDIEEDLEEKILRGAF